MARIFYGVSGDISKKIDKWIAVAGTPDIFSEEDGNLKNFDTKILGKWDIVSVDEALKRYPGADVWVTYRTANNTAKMLLTKLPPEKIHFLEADLEYRKGCAYLGNFISYRKDNFSPCCITGEAPVIRTSGSIRQRLAQWNDYTAKLLGDVRYERSNDCEKCHLLRYGFWRKSVKLDEINFGSNQPGDVCNFKCTYCFCEPALGRLKNDNDNDSLTTYEILRQISKMPEYADKKLILRLANGEFCANKHCDDMLDIFLENKWEFKLLSNFSIYNEKLARLMESGRIKTTTVSLDAGTRETFKAVKQSDSFDKVVANLKRYPVGRTRLLLKYIFLEGVNDNENDVNGYYETAKEIGGVLALSADLNAPFTDKMRGLALKIIKKAKADGIEIDAGSSYLNPSDAKFIAGSYAKAQSTRVS
jgi:hypothetical protein